MANTSYTQQVLGLDLNFRLRVQDAIVTVAWQIMNEAGTVPNHTQRAAFARQVLANPGASAQNAASWIVNRPNLIAANTTYDFTKPATVTDATDAAIQSQLSTDWNVLSGV